MFFFVINFLIHLPILIYNNLPLSLYYFERLASVILLSFTSGLDQRLTPDQKPHTWLFLSLWSAHLIRLFQIVLRHNLVYTLYSIHHRLVWTRNYMVGGSRMKESQTAYGSQEWWPGRNSTAWSTRALPITNSTDVGYLTYKNHRTIKL